MQQFSERPLLEDVIGVGIDLAAVSSPTRACPPWPTTTEAADGGQSADARDP